MKKVICHFSTVHGPKDTRILLKECVSLSKSGYKVFFMVNGDFDDFDYEGVSIKRLGKVANRFKRMFIQNLMVYNRVLKLKADIYHFHDFEMILVASLLRISGKKVICDIHEDLPLEILSKPYLPKSSRLLISKTVHFVESIIYRFYSALITATENIHYNYQSINYNSIVINNFPIKSELYNKTNRLAIRDTISYVGSITKVRGILEILDAIEITQLPMDLAGNFDEKNLEPVIRAKKGWNLVKYWGFIDRNTFVNEVLDRSICGLVIFHPTPNHINSQPNKLFEYMSAGVPIICSNFPLWKEIVEVNDCGITVDPLNPEEIAEAMKYLVDNPDRARQMGENGRKAVEEKYNWALEEEKLLKLYKELL